MKFLLRCAIALLPLIASSSAFAQILEPGRWRVMTTTVSGPAAPPSVATRCLTPNDVADLLRGLASYRFHVLSENAELMPFPPKENDVGIVNIYAEPCPL